MPRKRTEIGARAEKKIAELIARGGTAQSIAKALRAAGVKGVSERTIGRRMKEVRGAAKAPRGSKAEAANALREGYAAAAAGVKTGVDDGEDLPKPDEIPADAELVKINEWLARADTLGRAAFAKGDLEGMGKMGRLTSALLEAKRKATPPEKDDPNDSPEMRTLGEQVEARLLKMVDDIAKGR